MKSIRQRSSRSSFLELPRTPHSDSDVPFRPSRFDKTSLNMKKRLRERHSSERLHRRRPKHAGIKAGGANEDIIETGLRVEAHPKQRRSKSLPILADQEVLARQGPLLLRQVSLENLWRSHSRRWTMLSKAISTRGVTVASPTYQRVRKLSKQKRKPSPAIITLRRATSSLRRDSGITFFPTPTFSSTKTNFLSTFLSTVTGDGWSTRETNGNQLASAQQSTSQVLAWHSLLGSDVQSKAGSAIGPTFTEIDIEPHVSLQSGVSTVSPRRCSTRYLSRSSTYEVIWDENDTPSRSGSSSVSWKSVREGPSTGVRRPSAAVQQLETQLARAATQSRRQSSIAARRPSHESASELDHRPSFQAAINLALSRFVNEAALRHLPRSKASTTLKPPIQIPFEAPACVVLDDDDDDHAPVSQYGTEFFPPLAPDVHNKTSQLNTKGFSEDLGRSEAPQTPDRPRMGSSVGISNRKRRKFTTDALLAPNRALRNSLTGFWSLQKSAISKSGDEGAWPLLDTPDSSGSILV